jgi:hypothetical protein
LVKHILILGNQERRELEKSSRGGGVCLWYFTFIRKSFGKKLQKAIRGALVSESLGQEEVLFGLDGVGSEMFGEWALHLT